MTAGIDIKQKRYLSPSPMPAKPNYGRVRIRREPLSSTEVLLLCASFTFLFCLTILAIYFPE